MLARVKKAFKEAVYPSKCISCGLFFHVTEKIVAPAIDAEYYSQDVIKTVFQDEMSSFLCPSCVQIFSPVSPPFCARCGQMFKSAAAENHLCEDCIQAHRPFLSVRSAGLLNGALMETIHRLKYAEKIQLARPLGRLLFCAYMAFYKNTEIDMIVPIPLHRSKIRHRGFNQALLILREWPELAEAIHSPLIPIDFNEKILARKKKTESQTGLGKENRKINVKGAFIVKDPECVKGKHFLLIDDVYTTGATTHECAKILMKNSAGSVHILTLARADES